MKSLSLVCFVGLAVLLLSCGRENLPNQFEDGTYFKVSADSSERPAEVLDFDSSELGSCRVIPAGGELNVDTIEMSFRRGGKSNENKAETVIFYFPYTQDTKDLSTSGDFFLVLKRPAEILGHRNFDSWSNGQDRSACTVLYSTEAGRVRGSLDCPVQSEDATEKLQVKAQFACPLQD